MINYYADCSKANARYSLSQLWNNVIGTVVVAACDVIHEINTIISIFETKMFKDNFIVTWKHNLLIRMMSHMFK